MNSTDVEDLTPVKIDIYLTEYKALKDEILNRSSAQQSLTGINITAIGAIFSYSLSTGEYPILLAIPVVSSSLALLWLGHAFTIKEIVLYKARVLNPKISELVNDASNKMLEWEGRDQILLGGTVHRVWKTIYLFGTILVFLGTSLIAQTLVFIYSRHNLFFKLLWPSGWLLMVLFAIGLGLWASGSGPLDLGDELIEAISKQKLSNDDKSSN